MFNYVLGNYIKHGYTRPYRAQTNDKVERFTRTLATEWAYATRSTGEAEREAAYEVELHSVEPSLKIPCRNALFPSVRTCSQSLAESAVDRQISVP